MLRAGEAGRWADEGLILLMTAVSGNIISAIEGIPPASTFYLENLNPHECCKHSVVKTQRLFI